MSRRESIAILIEGGIIMPFQIVRNDITKMKTDAIVNTALPEPGFGRGTDSAVYKKAGIRKLLARRKEIGRIRTGEAEITPAFELEAKYIIHTVGPRWQGGGQGEARLLRNCYENSLKLARRHRCGSIAFPLISTGTYGFPKEQALQIAMSAIKDFLKKEDMMIYLVVFDGESFALSGKLSERVDSYIDEHYAAKSLEEEYGEGTDARRRAAAASMRPPTAGAVANAVGGMSALAGMPVSKQPQGEKRTPAGKQRTVTRKNRTVRSLDDVVAQLGETFQQRLLRLIDEKGMTDVELYKRANIDRKLFSKIRCNVNYRPKKMTALALAVALRLNLDETKDLLSRAELALSPSNKFDLIISFFIEQQIYDIYTINLALFEHEQPTLGETG